MPPFIPILPSIVINLGSPLADKEKLKILQTKLTSNFQRFTNLNFKGFIESAVKFRNV